MNLLPMNGNLNNSPWRAVENQWASTIKEGKSISVKIESIYTGSSVRPDLFNVRYSIGGGRTVIANFRNSLGGI
jgi:filamentous hemagglutinin